jgi:hypothetical protein
MYEARLPRQEVKRFYIKKEIPRRELPWLKPFRPLSWKETEVNDTMTKCATSISSQTNNSDYPATGKSANQVPYLNSACANTNVAVISAKESKRLVISNLEAKFVTTFGLSSGWLC